MENTSNSGSPNQTNVHLNVTDRALLDQPTYIEKLTALVIRAEQNAVVNGMKPAHPAIPGHWRTCDRPWCQDLYRDYKASQTYTKEMDAARLRDMENMSGCAEGL